MPSVEEEPIATIVSEFPESMRDDVRLSGPSIADNASGTSQLADSGAAMGSANAGLAEDQTMASTAASRLKARVTII